MSPKPLDTPPSSDVETSTRLPPSPPLSPPTVQKKKSKRTSRSAVDRLIGTLRLRRAGRVLSDSDWQTFKLSRAEYAEFERWLEADEGLWGFYHDKVRYDWEPQSGRYTLRMPTRLHESFIVQVEDSVVAGIAELTGRLEVSGEDGSGKVAQEMRKIWKGRSGTLELRVPKLVNSSQETASSDDGQEQKEEVVVKKSPDATFYHPSQPDLPCLVLEVSYSQQHKELPRLADSYIVNSQHAIRCVVGLDITYPPPGKKKAVKKQGRRATVSVWRPGVVKDDEGDHVGFCRQDMKAVAFRHADGQPCEGALEIALSDLLPPSILSTLPIQTTSLKLTIPFADLATYLTNAEHHTRPSDETTASFASATSSTAPKMFRKRKRTPSEELSDAREEAFLDEEARQLVKEMRVDGGFTARSRRIGGEDDVVDVVERRRSSRRRASPRAVGGSGS